MRIGVFICHCGSNIAGTVDCARVAEIARSYPDVVYATDPMYTCAEPGQAAIEAAIHEHRLDGVVVASCSPRMHETTFRRTVERTGLKESCRESVCSSLESVFSMAGAKVEYDNVYGGWQPNIDSPILRTMEATHEKLFGQKPVVSVMHAGLECGIIQEAYPDMDMISFGPDIRFPHSPDEDVRIDSVEKGQRCKAKKSNLMRKSYSHMLMPHRFRR